MMDEKHVVFGYVCEGFDVVDAINSVGTPSGAPKVDVIIADCGIMEGFDFALPDTPKDDSD